MVFFSVFVRVCSWGVSHECVGVGVRKHPHKYSHMVCLWVVCVCACVCVCMCMPECVYVRWLRARAHTHTHRERESVLFIGTQFSILYTSIYSPAEAATHGLRFESSCNVCVGVCVLFFFSFFFSVFVAGSRVKVIVEWERAVFIWDVVIIYSVSYSRTHARKRRGHSNIARPPAATQANADSYEFIPVKTREEEEDTYIHNAGKWGLLWVYPNKHASYEEEDSCGTPMSLCKSRHLSLCEWEFWRQVRLGNLPPMTLSQ
jgi:hypothetical protein